VSVEGAMEQLQCIADGECLNTNGDVIQSFPVQVPPMHTLLMMIYHVEMPPW